MRNQPPPNDPDILTLLNSPAEVGHKRITVGDMCVRRYRDRQHRCEPDWQVKVRLRQLLETGRYRASPPAGFRLTCRSGTATSSSREEKSSSD